MADVDNQIGLVAGESEYHCTPEWHLARLSKFCAVVYPFALRISKKSQRFHCSAEKLAEHFATSRWTVLRAMQELLDIGYFELISKERFRPSVYRVLTHREWAAAHPGSCAVRISYPWSEEKGDELGRRLYNASGGKLRFSPFQLIAYRNTRMTDEEIRYTLRDIHRLRKPPTTDEKLAWSMGCRPKAVLEVDQE